MAWGWNWGRNCEWRSRIGQSRKVHCIMRVLAANVLQVHVQADKLHNMLRDQLQQHAVSPAESSSGWKSGWLAGWLATNLPANLPAWSAV